MVTRVRAALVLAAGITAPLLGVVALHGMGEALPLRAIIDTQGEFEVAVGALLRLVGLAAGYWLTATTVIYLLATLSRVPVAVRAVHWATFPPLRRLADLVAARTLVAALILPLPQAEVINPGYVPIPAGDPPSPATTTTDIPPPTTDIPPPTIVPLPPMAEKRPLTAPPPGQPPDTEVSADTMEVVVKSGDNIWDLAAARLADLLGRPPTSREVVPYWQRVIEENQSRIRSGDPDLIFPGEILILPPP